MDNDSLFALKLYYEDHYDDEYEIIKMLKIELINQNIPENNINIILKEFYDSFNSNIDISVFENIIIENTTETINSPINHLINIINNQLFEENNDDDISENNDNDISENNDDIPENNNNTPENNNEITVQNLLNMIGGGQLNNMSVLNNETIQLNNNTFAIINNLLNMVSHDNIFHNANGQDVISVLNHEDIDKLNKYILENNLEDKCSICIDSLNETQEVIKLSCEHVYHSECIIKYLSNYNYKCPCCKIELGTPIHKI